ncbi:NAD-dependent epimerase/dehydratase family protein [Pseudomonas oligotrophica]|uniref:NAD-dependent epimerase/dehydratase family protein n=1 Tax=Pseudomonas oligotrophica TaxID=2912055 RepID=UPI001F43E5C4|nr:NAD(P)-dependent oxidoreductase [Pseudomonas oligotrophica]MCF7203580.1 NAD(P)-dependent oxidoreductase [Pseudomonas oligotrophica]
MRTILLTGGAGFIGSCVLRRLLADGFSVIVLIRSRTNLYRINDLLDQVVVYDIEQKKLSDIFLENHIYAILHLACKYGRAGEIMPVVQSNVIFGLELLELAVKGNVKIFINSDTFYNVPGKKYEGRLAPYILTKRQFLDWLLFYSQKIAIINLKLQHVYGSGDAEDKFLPWLVSQFFCGGGEVKLTGGEQQRDFVAVNDVASAFSFCLTHFAGVDKGFRTFKVGSDQPTTLKEFVLLAYDLYKKENCSEEVFLDFGAVPYAVDEIMFLDEITPSLTSIGWHPRSTAEVTLRELISEWSKHRCLS